MKEPPPDPYKKRGALRPLALSKTTASLAPLPKKVKTESALQRISLASVMLKHDPELSAICGGCTCRLNYLLPEIMASVRVVVRSRITSLTPCKTITLAHGEVALTKGGKLCH
jgi:hypothetical protein